MSKVGAPEAELSPTARLHIEKAVDGLVEEFGDHHSRDTVERLMEDAVRALVGDAQVEDFLPALAHRFTRERLKALARASGPEHASAGCSLHRPRGHGARPDGGGAANASLEGRVVAHSAGSTVGAAVDTGVMEVMGELGVDLSEAYAKPPAREVIDAADLVVTMGRSVGQIEIPPAARHDDWRVGDPTGAPPTRCGACAQTSTVASRRSSPSWNRRPLIDSCPSESATGTRDAFVR